MWECGSGKLFRQGCTRVQYPIWLCGRVHISVNVLRRLAAKFTVHSAINVIIWPFSILSRIPIVGVGYCIKIYDDFFSGTATVDGRCCWTTYMKVTRRNCGTISTTHEAITSPWRPVPSIAPILPPFLFDWALRRLDKR